FAARAVAVTRLRSFARSRRWRVGKRRAARITRVTMIPRLIHQTWRTKDVARWTPAERLWVGSWRANRGWRHELHDDGDCLRLVEEHHPDLVDAYRGLLAVEKADLWRCLVLVRDGGVYSDFDT